MQTAFHHAFHQTRFAGAKKQCEAKPQGSVEQLKQQAANQPASYPAGQPYAG